MNVPPIPEMPNYQIVNHEIIDVNGKKDLLGGGGGGATGTGFAQTLSDVSEQSMDLLLGNMTATTKVVTGKTGIGMGEVEENQVAMAEKAAISSQENQLKDRTLEAKKKTQIENAWQKEQMKQAIIRERKKKEKQKHKKKPTWILQENEEKNQQKEHNE